MNEKETYQIEVACSNCGRNQEKSVNVPKGTKWYDHVDELELKCKYCGCNVKMNIVY